MNKAKLSNESDTSVEDIYLGELAARIAQHERAEFARTRRIIEEQDELQEMAERLRVLKPGDVQ